MTDCSQKQKQRKGKLWLTRSTQQRKVRERSKK